MTIQFSTEMRNALLEAHEIILGGQTLSAGSGSGGSITGTASPPKLQIWSGSPPANCSLASTGVKLAEWTLAADWSAAASGGSKALSGVPLATTGVGAGSAGYYRFTTNSGATCHEQGTVTATGGGGDMTIDNVVIAVSQAVQITGFTKTAPGA